MQNNKLDIKGQVFGEWEVLEYLGNNRWKCKCSCGTIKDVDGHELRRGGTLSCGHNRKSEKDLTNKEFGEWTVISKSTKPRYYTCKCSCGTIKDVSAYSLNHGKSKSCGHDTSLLKNLEGQRFGEWTVLKYIGNSKWKCECSCGTIKDIYGEALRKNNTKSCGCLRYNNSMIGRLKKYGDYRFSSNNKSRLPWQIDIINDKDKLLDFINLLMYEKGRKVSNEEIAEYLGVTRTAIYEATKKFNITDYKLDKYHSIKIKQKEVQDYILSIYNGDIQIDTRRVITPYELDIYMPEKKLAIEFNGDYWHSSINKDKKYHQEKTLACAKKGIHLIHIFEYEWNDTDTRNKIKNYIRKLLCNSEIIYGRNTDISIINKDTAKEFCNKYHLQNYTDSDINIGCFYKEELVSVLTIGKSRFSSEYQYEIIRYCNKDDKVVIGGLEKMFNMFLNKYNPSSVVTYSDIAKFTGNCYLKIGFKVINITEPGYIWIDTKSKSLVSRYQTQKSKLIKNGLGVAEETEDEIMYSLGYLKLYNSGNIKLDWRLNNG